MNEEQRKAAQIVLDYLEENNSHTIGRLLAWDLFGLGDNKLMLEVWEVAKNEMYKQYN
jgi:hypothetical protein